ncbi:Sucrose transport protein [Arachis hypogaea]|nr:Sucrose transport protein [Arachis hypogaea]
MAVGNKLGYLAVLFSRFDVICGCVLRPEQVSITEEESSEREEEDDRCTLVKCFREMFRTMKRLNKPMLCLMAAELFNWVAFARPLYNPGYWYGTQGLMKTWVVAGVMSMAVQPIGGALSGAKNLWAARNFILAGGLTMTFYISKLAKDKPRKRNYLTPSSGILVLVFCFFGVLGIPIGITLSVPPALASIYSNESGSNESGAGKAEDYLPPNLYPLSNTFLFVPDTFYLPTNSLLYAQLHTFFFDRHEFTEFIDRIRLQTGGANLSVKDDFGGLHSCRNLSDSMGNTNLRGVRNIG